MQANGHQIQFVEQTQKGFRSACGMHGKPSAAWRDQQLLYVDRWAWQGGRHGASAMADPRKHGGADGGDWYLPLHVS